MSAETKQKLRAEPGSWELAMELLDRGDNAFVEEIRAVRDPDKLGPFAREWYNDRRPAARRLMFAYLDKPLNALRHEPLVKRLFKLAEEAGDDELMAHFLVAFDRSIRRIRRKRHRYDRVLREYQTGEMATTPNDVMPRPDAENLRHLKDWQRERWPDMRLFSIQTRQYLRRRSWRYFRKLGRKDPARYMAVMPGILTHYTDEDVKDGLALLDNWGLVHIMFHFSPALLSKPTGWVLLTGKSLADVKAEPMFVKFWQADATPLLGLLDTAPSKAVRVWAIQMLEAHHAKVLAKLPLEKLVAWLGHPSSEMVTLAVQLLKTNKELKKVEPERLIRLLQQAGSETLEMLCTLLAKVIKPDQVTVGQAVTLARSRPQVLAEFGFKLLKGKSIEMLEDSQALLDLTEAQATNVRPAMIAWACKQLSASPAFEPAWVVEMLDSRHTDVRSEGWKWLHNEQRAADDVTVWQRLLESPYDDVRLQMIEHLDKLANSEKPDEREMRHLDAEMVRFLWATVLLNVSRGARHKPGIVKQLLARLERTPGDVPQLLPLLGVALRSLRGPEFRAGLVGILQWVRRHPDREAAVAKLFPELKLAQIEPGNVGPDWATFRMVASGG